MRLMIRIRQLMRLMTLVSVVGGYPLIFFALRDSSATLIRLIDRAPSSTAPMTVMSEEESHTSELRLSIGLQVALMLAAMQVPPHASRAALQLCCHISA
jgi:hypothetical protein